MANDNELMAYNNKNKNEAMIAIEDERRAITRN